VPTIASAADLEAQFAQVFPVSIDEAWAAATADPNAMPCVPAWVCTGATLSPGESANVDCDDETHSLVTIDGQAGAIFNVGASDVSLTRCDGTAPSRVLEGGDSFSSPAVTHWESLAAGTYSVTHVASPPPKDVTLEAYLSQPLVGASCAAAPMDLAPDTPTIVGLPPGTLDGWIAVNGSLGQSYSVSRANFLSGTVAACGDCGGSGCADVPTGGGVPFSVGTGSAVRLQRAVAAAYPPGKLFFLPQPAH
jgi:hypothetical protein